MSLAFVFPGQGAQAVGMGKALAEGYVKAKEIFQEVDSALGENLSHLIWAGNIKELTLTENAQPALMATSLAAFKALEEEGITIKAAEYVAGHSLGEYSALAAAGSISISDAARLLRLRGQAMQEAVPVGEGAMAALLGLDFETAQEISREVSSEGAIVQAANDNDPSQVVISGHKAAVEAATKAAKEKGAKRAVILPVSAPFHSPLMAPAAEKMREALAETVINAPKAPLIANVSASAIRDPEEIRKLLVEQVTGVVRWRESIMWMASSGVDEFWEIGAGKALSGMIRRIAPETRTRAIGIPEDARAAAQSLLAV